MPFQESYLNKGVVAMVHVEALPGTPKSKLSMDQIVAKAVSEAKIYVDAGVDAIMIENMHDVPYLNGCVGPEIVASMTVVAVAVKAVAGKMPVGIQILAANNKEAIAVALAAGLQFVRVEGFVFGHVADEGYIDSCAGDILRFRRAIGADHVKVFGDIKKKHSSHAVTADVSIADTAHAAEYFLVDGVIVTGAATGCEADLNAVISVKKAVHIPVLVGSGVTLENVDQYLAACDCLIVGSYFKEQGFWTNPVDPKRVVPFMEKVKKLRGHN